MTIYNVATTAELYAALSSAQGGDRIELAPGDYGEVLIRSRFTSDVTIISADPSDPARFTEINLAEASHIVFDSLRVGGGATSDFNGSSYITVRNSVFAGAEPGEYGTVKGLTFRNADHIVVENNEFFGWIKAFSVHTGTDVIVRNNNVHSVNNDAFNFTSVNGLLVEGNWIHDFFTDPNIHHNDMIQVWDTNPDTPTQNVIIRDNFFDAGTGRSVQTIYIANGRAGADPTNLDLYYRNILIEDNVIYNSHTHGITVGETIGLTIINNTILRNLHVTSGPLNEPQIRIFGAIDVVIEDNILHRDPNGKNFVVQDTDPNAPNYYGDLFVDALSPDADLADLRAIAGGIIESLGVGAEMTHSSVNTVLNVPSGSGSTFVSVPSALAPSPAPAPQPKSVPESDTVLVSSGSESSGELAPEFGTSTIRLEALLAEFSAPQPETTVATSGESERATFEAPTSELVFEALTSELAFADLVFEAPASQPEMAVTTLSEGEHFLFVAPTAASGEMLVDF